MLKIQSIQGESQSTAIYGLVKQICLGFFVIFLLCAAWLNAAQPVFESSVDSPANNRVTVKQLLQRIAALEYGFERESQAIVALDERIAQLELKYLDVKSGIEHSTAGRVIDAATPTSLQSFPVSVMADDGGDADNSGAVFEHNTVSTAAPYPALNADELLSVAGGLLAILLLLCALWLYRKKRGQSDAVIDTDFITAADPAVRGHEADKQYQQSLQKLIALKKAAQGAEQHDESAIVIKQDQLMQNQLSHKSAHSVITDVRTFMKQEQPDRAIQLLESWLAKNNDSDIGWQLLFRMLHNQNKRSTFRKHALRFKRLEQFPETWEKIQSWGLVLEPNEPLYMNKQERKRRFFSS